MNKSNVAQRALAQDRPLSPLFGRIRRLGAMLWQERETVPWAVGSVDYAERYWSLVREAWRWRIAFTLALLVIGVLGVALAVVARASRVVPYIVQVDRHGYAVAIKPAEDGAVTDERVVIAAVAKWIRSMRTVLGDVVAQRKLVDDVYAMLAPGTAATHKTNTWFRAHNPYEAGPRKVDVEITLVSPIGSGKSFKVEWTERTREGGSGESMARFSAFVQVAISPTQKLDDVIANPLGVFVVDYAVTLLQ